MHAFYTALTVVPKLVSHCGGSTTQTKVALKWELIRSANLCWPAVTVCIGHQNQNVQSNTVCVFGCDLNN